MSSDIPRPTSTIGGIATGMADRFRPLLLSLKTPANPRVATSVTLCGVLLAAIVAASGSADAVASKPSGARSANAPAMLPAVGSGPAFCKQQTWPHIDPRCLNRPDPAAAVSVPASTKSVLPAEIKTGSGVEVAMPGPALPKSSSELPTAGALPPAPAGISSGLASPQAAPILDLPPPPGSVRLSDTAATANDQTNPVSQTRSFDSGAIPLSAQPHRSRHNYGARFDRHTGPF